MVFRPAVDIFVTTQGNLIGDKKKSIARKFLLPKNLANVRKIFKKF